ncbi:hypothetical protein BDD12DRAFT_273048 [Trichophaea hybrida]|nr:hypothetical protein BDD12DRAFT_273048 [Trichophaea hybrida]
MNAIFGRSKSKHRKAGVGNLKDRIGNPTPLDPIKINGSFIDLRPSPHHPDQEANVPPIPQLSTATLIGPEEGKGVEVRSDTNFEHEHQTNHPQRPSRSGSDTPCNEFDLDDYFRGNSDSDNSNGYHNAYEAERDQEYGYPLPPRRGITAADETRPYQSQSRPYSPYTARLNFSRPTISPTPDDVRSIAASFSSVSSAPPQDPTVGVRTQDSSNSKPTQTEASTPTIYSPARYQPYSSAATPLQVVVDQGLVQEQEFQERGRTTSRFLQTERRRSSSSNYSSTTSVDPSRIVPPQQQFEQQRHRPERLDIQSAKDLQQVETAKYFESDSVPTDPVSPLLPSPRRDHNSVPRDSPDISPELGPIPENSSPGLFDLNLNKDTLGTLDISFSDFSMPSPAMGTQNHLQRPIISAPQSPELQKLPTHLGPLLPVQRELNYGGISNLPGEKDNSAIMKRSLSRKVSTKLRTLVGAGTRPREAPGAITTATSIPTTRQRQNSKGTFTISNPIPIPEEEQQVDPEIEQIMARFDIERPLPARRVEEIQDKVDDWHYNPSAASSASNISLHPSYTSGDNATTGTELESSGGNPGLSSHRTSSRSSQRNATPDSPITPADDGYSYPFTALRGHLNVGDAKSNATARQRDYHSPAVVTKHSEEVPMFLDTAGEVNGPVPSFTHEPPTPEPHQTTFSRVHDSILPEPEHFMRKTGVNRVEEELLQPGMNRIVSRDFNGSTDTSNRPSPTISTAPTSVASSPLLSKRLPTARKPPFGPGSPKMLLRSATMSSRQGGTPLKPLKPVGTIAEDEPSQGHNDTGTPVSQYDRPDSAFSFVRDDASAIQPDDSISQVGSVRSHRGSPLRSNSPTPFDIDRSLRQPQLRDSKSHSNIRSVTTSRSQKGRVAILSRLDTDLPSRPSTGTPGRAPLRLNTDVPPPVPGAFSAVEGTSRTSMAQGLHPPPVVKRSKSVGEGLRRAFSRRTPNAPRIPSSTPPPTDPAPPNPDGIESSPSSPVTEVSGPLGCGPSSESSMARWNTAIRAASVSSALQRARASSGAQPPASQLDPSVPSNRANRASVILKAQPLTAEDRRGMRHAPGTLFIRTCEEGDGVVGACREHQLKPRKGGVLQKCAFCDKGPFANMWVCLDEGPVAEVKDGALAEKTTGEKGGGGNTGERESRGERCGFVVCRMCCNEKVQEGSAEIF